ncbi:NAD(P)-dependent oxidoreductase [Bacillus thermotolerans]|uniref:2-hydroxy-3-oxopropionate reductase n=1 Tax=Bacillus thermotolerans TaxID=1221996 RepID=A0A0F5IAM4_BACTR|nr:NAD(P)-dependent oxidoreductase [Bacillus thermotolerans]KKB39172.1 2-hydroxy-3-oxopropionate reductase [Bacillus thermotolerans]KKB42564.1 2-hydroxy-3-oxopropionate reductase [Bacillus thermotolerans]KKB42649.1 2-hydroxy-3-oxopropionate reductase [Bacillus thermotolerans]
MRKIGFIGTGVMGKSMAQHLQQAGHQLFVYTRTKSKAEELISEGAVWCQTPAEAAQEAEVMFTIVGEPSDVEGVYFGEQGILAGSRPGQVVIDMTTSKPSLAVRIYEEAKKKKVDALDAPVSGGDIGAKNGTLAIMVGGNRSVYEKVLPLFNIIGENIVYQGEAGAGQHAKMSNQITVAGNMIGVCEALVYAREAGLDLENVLKSITTGAAGSWSLSNLAPRMLKEDYEPGFYIKHFIKDMKIAIEESERMGIRLPGLSLAKKMYEELSLKGESESGTQALIKYWD